MVRRVPRLLIGLAVVLISLTGLLAVSALVPDVGCQRPSNDFLVTPTRLRLSAPATAPAGQPFSVNGTLEKDVRPPNPAKPEAIPMEPFLRQKVVISAQMQSITVVTDDAGKFTAEITLRIPGVCNIDASYPGDSLDYYDKSRDSRKIEITGEMPAATPTDYRWLIYLFTAVVVVWGSYLLYRRLRSSGRKEPSKREPRRVRWPKPKELVRWLPGILAVLALGAVLYALVPRGAPTISHSEPDADRIPTKTRLDIPAQVRPGENFSIKGTLSVFQNNYWLPKARSKIDIFATDVSTSEGSPSGIVERIATLTTDDLGQFATQASLQYPRQYEINAVFSDTGDLYLESSDSRIITVGALPSPFGDWTSPGWFSLIVGLPLAALIIVGCFLYYRHYRRTHQPEAKETPQEVAAPPPPPPTVPAHVTSESPVKIELPQIAPPFPDVWGKGDDLLIVFTVDGARHPLAEATLDMELEPGSRGEIQFGQGGRISREHTYARAGKYEIKAELSGKARNGYVPTSRMVRIVDYREEIVRLYNEMVAILRGHKVPLTPKMTAREVEIRLTKAMPELSRETIRQLVSDFEEANYSLHRITRTGYERMYLACNEVKKYGRERKPETQNTKLETNSELVN